VTARARAQGQGPRFLSALSCANGEGNDVGNDGYLEPRTGSCGAGRRRQQGHRGHDFLEDWSSEEGDQGARRP